ncbi:MAG: glycine--tRNA ligase subunit beta [Gemmatimonadales bacterium]|nr:glycine--tRNA ligase subunit beta [Gemmatimonadales bacterium]
MNQDQEIKATGSFLLEIGSEEIPARFIPGALKELETRAAALLDDSHLACREIRTVATPRRLTLLVEGLALRQPDRLLEIKGPPVSVAFDGEGNPTQAALGFARKVGLELDDCERRQDKRGEFLLAKKVEPGRPTAEILAEALPQLVLSIPFRKVMRWGNGDLEYPRPLQWLVALLDEEIVPVRIGDLVAGRNSRGHRTLSEDRTLEITRPGDYERILADGGVIVDQDRRRQIILDGFQRLLADYDSDARLLEDEELLTEVVFLCEHPTAFLGQYSNEFSSLPAEVITTALKAHQRYFSLISADGQDLKPRFAAVRDGGSEHLEKVTEGNERVLRARLADALFYWEFDQKKTPDERTQMLGSVTWLEGFGTMLDKVRRIEDLAPWLWENGLGANGAAPADLTRAGTICKSDLVSEMIKDGKEFTKLEGLIGARYAALAGESKAVCLALERHMLPRTARGELPGDRISSVLSVADRLDTVAGCWLAGFIPTGAKDPYALRRHVLAILRILLDLEANFDLEAGLVRAMEKVAPLAPDKDALEAMDGLREFVLTRVSGFFTDNLGTDQRVVRAVMPARWRKPVDALAWVRALESYREEKNFQLLATGFKRCRNILEGDTLPVSEFDSCLERWENGVCTAPGGDFSDLPEPSEKKLLANVAAVAADLRSAENAGDYDRVFALLSELGPSIDEFFETVRVNVEDEKLRRLRHGFLREIHGVFARYADFAQVAPL